MPCLAEERYGFGDELIGLSSGDEVISFFLERDGKNDSAVLQFSFQKENGTVVPCNEEMSFLLSDWDGPIMKLADQEVVHIVYDKLYSFWNIKNDKHRDIWSYDIHVNVEKASISVVSVGGY